ncbi:MAG TPA: OmpH family outer membrane protein [Halanaerobiales bacterium]|nr:OmpH family outer membrane protein [Halanaerobiales bacterium]
MRRKKKFLWVLVIAAVIITATAYYTPFTSLASDNSLEGEIAYVDIQRIFELHPDKAEAEKELNKAAQMMQSELEEKVTELNQEEQQELLSEYQSELSQKEQKLIQNVLAEIENAIKKVAEQKKVKLVLDKRNVIYGGYDMTEDVINYIEEQRSKNNNDENSNQEKSGE